MKKMPMGDSVCNFMGFSNALHESTEGGELLHYQSPRKYGAELWSNARLLGQRSYLLPYITNGCTGSQSTLYFHIRHLKNRYFQRLFLCAVLWSYMSGLQIRVRIGKICFFLILNIWCGYSKEPSQWDGSFEHQKPMLKLIGYKIITILSSFNFLNWITFEVWSCLQE